LNKNEIPRCVATCTSGALSFVDVDEAAADDKKNLISARVLSNFIGRRS
jgi:Fe-S-cluster-containing dehydrogenase component